MLAIIPNDETLESQKLIFSYEEKAAEHISKLINIFPDGDFKLILIKECAKMIFKEINKRQDAYWDITSWHERWELMKEIEKRNDAEYLYINTTEEFIFSVLESGITNCVNSRIL